MKNLKKILIAAMVGIIAVFSLSTQVFAKVNDSSNPRVIDGEDLITENEEDELSKKIQQLTDKYDIDIAIVTNYTLEGYSPRNYAEMLYKTGKYGVGKKDDGLLLLISMEERDWYIFTNGEGHKVIADKEIDKLGSTFTSYLTSGEYYTAFNKFLDSVEKEFKKDKVLGIVIPIGIGFGVSLIAALITVFVFKSQLKSVKFEYAAQAYEVDGSFKLTRSNDIFLYRTVTKTKKPDTSSSGSSGGGSSSSGGGGGKF